MLRCVLASSIELGIHDGQRNVLSPNHNIAHNDTSSITEWELSKSNGIQSMIALYET